MGFAKGEGDKTGRFINDLAKGMMNGWSNGTVLNFSDEYSFHNFRDLLHYCWESTQDIPSMLLQIANFKYVFMLVGKERGWISCKDKR
jgi:hypothetical protein